MFNIELNEAFLMTRNSVIETIAIYYIYYHVDDCQLCMWHPVRWLTSELNKLSLLA